MRIVVVRAGPRHHQQVSLELPPGATVAQALTACPLDATGIGGYAVHGVRVDMGTELRDGDRLELLAPLLVDPKEARRRRAMKPGG